MQNPQEKGQLTARTMFEYDNHQNIPWNIHQYQPVREYLDPLQQIAQRKYAQTEKGQKNNKYLTKKGFYMDYHVKVVKVLPPPSQYNLPDAWVFSENDKKMSLNRKINTSLSKYTYLDRIQIEQKNRKKPGVGSYNLNKTADQIKSDLQKQKQKKRSMGQKRYFYQDTQYLSNVPPGIGSHNPHLDVSHLKLNKTYYKQWIKKHQKEFEHFKKKKLAQPDPGTYSPLPLQFGTFDRLRTASIGKRKKNTVKAFGTDTKFYYDRPNKKKIIEQRPDPGAHNVMIEWKGKGLDPTKNNWIRSRSTGFSPSVYH